MWVDIRGNLINLSQVFLIQVTAQSTMSKGAERVVLDPGEVEALWEKSPYFRIKLYANREVIGTYSKENLEDFKNDYGKIILAVRLSTISEGADK